MKSNTYKRLLLILIKLISILSAIKANLSFNTLSTHSTILNEFDNRLLTNKVSEESLIQQIFNLITNNSNETFHSIINDCNGNITQLMNTKSELISKMIANSGKDEADIGIEYDCLGSGLLYFMLTYRITNSSTDQEQEIINLLGFGRDFFTGLCIIKECNETMNVLFSKENQQFTKYLTETLNYSNITFLQDDSVNLQKEYPISYIFFIVISILILIWASIKLIAFFFGDFTLKREEISFRKIKNIIYEEQNDETNSLIIEITNKSNDFRKNQEIYEPLFISENEQKKLSRTSNQMKSINRLWFEIINFLSIGSDFVLLTSTKNDYYCEKGLKMIAFYRMILMFLIILNHYFYTLYKYPGRDFFNVEFYSSYWFCIVKITVFAADCFMALDAFVTGYKLMCYLKKNINSVSINGQNYFGKLLVQFSLLSIPKIVIFFANFYILHYFAPYYSNLITDGSVHEFYLKNIAKEKECEQNPSIIFIPFYMAYYDYNNPTKMSFSNCYRFVNVYLNQFYIFLIFLILFYLMCRIRSKIFDATIALFVVLNSLLSFITFLPFATSKDDCNTTFNFYSILGQNLTLKHPHLFFNTYMLGIFSGFIYFYYCDVLSKSPIIHTIKYTPFSFCHSIMNALDSLSVKTKYAIVFFCIAIQILLSMSYNIFRSIYQSSDTILLSFNIKLWMEIYDCYDKQIFTLLFLTSVTIIIITPNDNFVRHLSNANLFILFSRINFSIFSSMDSIIYVSYCVFIFQLKMTYPNLIYMTIGEYGLVTIVCVIMTLLFEVPSRIAIKILLRKLRKRRNSIILQENYNKLNTQSLSEVIIQD